MQYNAIQCNTMQYNAIQYNAIQCNTMQYNTIQYTYNTYILIHLTQDDGQGQYKVVGFVSHMGKSTQVGHYVAHLRQHDANNKNNFVLFNDEKVAVCKNVPSSYGYIYLLERQNQFY